MSHKSTVKTKLENLDATALKAACEELGLSMVEASGKQSIRAYSNMNVGSAGCRTFVLSGFSGNYQAAIVEDENGVCNFEYDKWNGHVEKAIGNDGGKLNQLYQAHRVEAEAKKKRFTLFQYDDKGRLVRKKSGDRFTFQGDGTVKLKLRRMKS